MLTNALNERILRIAEGIKYSVADTAPNSFEQLTNSANGSGIVVWQGASELTIFGDPKVNYAFRAWHDSLHLRLNAPFTLQGELIVALEQARIMQCTVLAETMLAEVYGQALVLDQTGMFIKDQIEFTVNYLKAKGVL